jgi:uncharacterized protein (TIGR02466 family)
MIDQEKIKNLFISGELDAVMDIVDKLLQENKENVFLWNIKGMVHSKKKEFSDSLSCFEECLLLDDKNDLVYANLAFAFLELDNFDKAIENFKKALEINANSFQYHFELGKIYIKKDVIPNAITSLEKSLVINSDNTKASILLVGCYSQMSNPIAITLMERVVSSHSENTDYMRIISNLYRQFHDYNNSIKYLDSYLSLIPDDVLALYDKGLCYYGLRDFNLAETYFMKSTEIDPDFQPNWLALGQTYYLQYKFKEAIEVLLWSHGLEPKDIVTLNQLADSYLASNQKDLAFEYIEKSLALDDGNISTLCTKASLLLNVYNLSESESLYKKAIELDENSHEAHFGLGALYSFMNNKKKSIVSFKKSLEILPSRASTKFALASVYKKDKKYALAIDLFTESKETLWEENVLECLYCSEEFELFDNFLQNNLTALNLSRKSSAIIKHSSIHLENKTKNIFCEEPFDYIQFSDIDKIDGLPNFNQRLIEEFYIKKMDLTKPEGPLLFNGTQSALNIFSQDSDLFNIFKDFLLNELKKYFVSFEGSKDGFITNSSLNFALNGWMVDIKKGGFLESHNHPMAWVSGVYYLKIPKKNNKQEANIKFTLDNKDFPESSKNFPEREIDVKESRLIFFPSSLYHQTNSFTDDADRISVSFDFVPFRNR